MRNPVIHRHFLHLTEANIKALYPDDDIADLEQIYAETLRSCHSQHRWLGFSVFLGIAAFFFSLLYFLEASVFCGDLLPCLILAFLLSAANFFVAGHLLTMDGLNTPLQHILVTAGFLLLVCTLPSGTTAPFGLFCYPSGWHVIVRILITALLLFLHTCINYSIFSLYRKLWSEDCDSLDFLKNRHRLACERVRKCSDSDLADIISRHFWQYACDMHKAAPFAKNTVVEILASFICSARNHYPKDYFWQYVMKSFRLHTPYSFSGCLDTSESSFYRMRMVYQRYCDHNWTLFEEDGARSHLELLDELCGFTLLLDKKELLAFQNACWRASNFCKWIFRLRQMDDFSFWQMFHKN